MVGCPAGEVAGGTILRSWVLQGWPQAVLSDAHASGAQPLRQI